MEASLKPVLALALLLCVTAQSDVSPAGYDNSVTASSGVESSLRFVNTFKNYTNLKAGESIKLKCEVTGEPRVTRFSWYVNEVPLENSKRIKIKNKLNGVDTQWSRLRIRDLEDMDRGFYRCEASNGITVIHAESLLKVTGNEHSKPKWQDDTHYDDDYHEDEVIPESFPLDFGADLSGGVEGLPPHLQYNAGRHPFQHSFSQDDEPSSRGRAASGFQNPDLPSLKPNDYGRGTCQVYTGSICAAHVGSGRVFISEGLTQTYVEQMLQKSLNVIAKSPDLEGECAQYAIPAICLSTLPICDRQTNKPRKVKIILFLK